MPERPKGVRLQVVLAHAGVGSRRACEQLIRDGEVSVDGRVVTELGTRVDDDAEIRVGGRRVRAGGQAPTWIMLNKPREVVSTVSDPEGRRTVMEFIEGARGRLYPVGRLDYHSEGLILLTNDGELTHLLTHPSSQIPRTYLARVKGSLTEDERDRLRRGIVLDGKPTGPIETRTVKRSARSETSTWVEVTVREGRYHLVREALLRFGHPVSRLRRVAFGPLRLGRLEAGGVRILRPEEVEALRRAVATGRAAAAKRGPRAGGPAKRRKAPAARSRPRRRPENA